MQNEISYKYMCCGIYETSKKLLPKSTVQPQ